MASLLPAVWEPCSYLYGRCPCFYLHSFPGPSKLSPCNRPGRRKHRIRGAGEGWGGGQMETLSLPFTGDRSLGRAPSPAGHRMQKLYPTLTYSIKRVSVLKHFEKYESTWLLHLI